MKKLIVVFFMLLHLFSSEAAGLFKIINRTGTCVTACDALENEVNANLPNADQSNYLKGMANSSVIAQKGLGVDYASNIEYIEVGYAVGVGADLGSNSTSDLINGDVDADQISGVGVGSSVSLGLNGGLFGSKLGFLDLKQTNFYGYFLSLDAPDIDGLEGNVTSYGFHVQTKLIPKGNDNLGLFTWGGIEFITGFESSSTELKFTNTITETATAGGATATFNGTATVGADIQTYTIPFEVSTNLRLLYAVTFFGGLGADFSFGSAKSIANLTGDITVSGGGTGDAVLDLGSEASPSLFSLRTFGGIQFNLTALKIFVLANKGLTNDTFALALGARLAF